MNPKTPTKTRRYLLILLHYAGTIGMSSNSTTFLNTNEYNQIYKDIWTRNTPTQKQWFDHIAPYKKIIKNQLRGDRDGIPNSNVSVVRRHFTALSREASSATPCATNRGHEHTPRQLSQDATVNCNRSCLPWGCHDRETYHRVNSIDRTSIYV